MFNYPAIYRKANLVALAVALRKNANNEQGKANLDNKSVEWQEV